MSNHPCRPRAAARLPTFLLLALVASALTFGVAAQAGMDATVTGEELDGLILEAVQELSQDSE